jgi:hypothetical protein
MDRSRHLGIALQNELRLSLISGNYPVCCFAFLLMMDLGSTFVKTGANHLR